jgi:glycosyltransferase involved in cell wall biosynthesis
MLKHFDREMFEPVVVMPSDGVIGKKLKARGIKTIHSSRLRERLYEHRFRTVNRWTSILSFSWNVWDSLVFIHRLNRIIKTEEVDIVYCNHMMVKVMGILAGLRRCLPVITHCRTIYDNPLERLFYVVFSSLPNVKRIVAVSHAAAANYRVLEHKVWVVHNGVDLQEHSASTNAGELRQRFEISDSTIVVGYFGRLVKWKGVTVLLEAAKKIARSRRNIAFAVVGGEPNGSATSALEEYGAYLKDNGLEGRVFLTGFQENVLSYLADLDIVVVPSLRPDPFPRTVIEAMAFGKPVVASALGGIPEAIRHEHTGILVRPGSVSELVQQILRLADDARLREALGARAAKAVQEEFNAESTSRAIQEIIAEVVCNQRSEQGSLLR